LKDIKYNLQKKKNKKTNTNLQNTTEKTKASATRTHKNPGVTSGSPEGKVVPAPVFKYQYYI